MTTSGPIQIGRAAYYRGDCLDVMRDLLDQGCEGTVDSIVTDPPYGLGFMGKSWDSERTIAFKSETWELALRLLKPGGHLLACGGSRTYHRLAVAVEDAGFEIRDQIQWIYGSGFPKSHDVSKAIDKLAGDENHAAQQWAGWGTALKPAHEPIVMARKPLEGTVACNVMVHGCGGINIDGCRVETSENLKGGRHSVGEDLPDGRTYGSGINRRSKLDYIQPTGRFPANLIHDGSDEADTAFAVSGTTGTASRFFYAAKAGKSERSGSAHPTVKPLSLMRYLTRLVTPPGGVVLDPFSGSGTTLEAAILEGFYGLGIELTADYWPDIEARLHRCQP